MFCHLSFTGSFRTQVYIEAYESDYYNHELQLQADVAGSWKVGDYVVVASTDYDTNQAEKFEIIEVNGDSITVDGMHKSFFLAMLDDANVGILYLFSAIGELFFEHYADVYEGVEMCAEVSV